MTIGYFLDVPNHRQFFFIVPYLITLKKLLIEIKSIKENFMTRLARFFNVPRAFIYHLLSHSRTNFGEIQSHLLIAFAIYQTELIP